MAAVGALPGGSSAQAVRDGGLKPFVVSADAVAQPLDGKTGDAARGRGIVLDRANGNCLICHALSSEPAERFQGNIGPDLKGVGGRLSAGQMRLRLIDQSLVNPSTIMPPYYRIDRLTRVGQRFAGKPGLDPQQIEDIVAYLTTLWE